MKNPELKKLTDGFFTSIVPNGPLLGEGVGLGDLEAAKLILINTKAQGGQSSRPVGLAEVRTVDATKFAALTAKLIDPKTHIEKTVSAFPKPIYVREYNFGPPGEKPAPDAWKEFNTLYKYDDRTYLNAERGASLALGLENDKGTATPAWAQQFATVRNAPLAAVVDLKVVRELIKAETAGRQMPASGAMMFTMLSPLWEQADTAVLGVQTADGMKLSATAYCVNEEGAKRSQRDARRTRADGQRLFAGRKEEPGRPRRHDRRRRIEALCRFGDDRRLGRRDAIRYGSQVDRVRFAIDVGHGQHDAHPAAGQSARIRDAFASDEQSQANRAGHAQLRRGQQNVPAGGRAGAGR
ncbi:MAG: hypothetical protein QM811_30600 [Pirellulales bacterium]